MGLSAAASIATIAASLASVGTSVAGTVQQKKAIKDQEKREDSELAKLRKKQQQLANRGFGGTILTDRGLGGSQVQGTGASTLLGG